MRNSTHDSTLYRLNTTYYTTNHNMYTTTVVEIHTTTPVMNYRVTKTHIQTEHANTKQKRK